MTTIVAPPWEEQPTEGGIADAPSDGKTYGRKDAAWSEVTSVGGDAAGFAALRRTYADAGLTLVDGSFETGGTLSSATDVLLLNAAAKAYAWTGTFPKVVAAGATPATSGGIGAGAWVDRTDLTLRSELNLVVKTFDSVDSMVASTGLRVGQKIFLTGYHRFSPNIGGGHLYVSDDATTADNGFT